jgi:hypothetical protein
LHRLSARNVVDDVVLRDRYWELYGGATRIR